MKIQLLTSIIFLLHCTCELNIVSSTICSKITHNVIIKETLNNIERCLQSVTQLHERVKTINNSHTSPADAFSVQKWLTKINLPIYYCIIVTITVVLILTAQQIECPH